MSGPIPLFATNLSPRHTVEQAWDLREEGWSHTQIAAELRVPRGTVAVWLSGRNGDKQLYDPYLDEVALRRALDGDREVFKHLTLYERAEFLNRVVVIREREIRENPATLTGAESVLMTLSLSLGLSRDRLLRAAGKRLWRGKQAAA